MKEEWRPIKGYEGIYEVSNMGKIKSLNPPKSKTPIIRKPFHYGGGYQQMAICKNKVRNQILVHRVVAQTFVPNPHNKPEVNHINGNKSDNRAENLEWCTSSENQIHAYKELGVNPVNRKLQKKHVFLILRSSLGYKKLGKLLKVDPVVIYNVRKGKSYKDYRNEFLKLKENALQ